MAKIVVSLATGVSVMLLIGMLLLTFAGKMAGTSGLPLSLTDDLHLSTWSQWWDVRLVVFNDLKHGPGQEEKVWTIKPPADPDTLEMNEQQLGDTLGVYAHIEQPLHGALTWSVAVSLWYLAALFALLPVLWMVEQFLRFMRE